jgi:hypothetical protein
MVTAMARSSLLRIYRIGQWYIHVKSFAPDARQAKERAGSVTRVGLRSGMAKKMDQTPQNIWNQSLGDDLILIRYPKILIIKGLPVKSL